MKMRKRADHHALLKSRSTRARTLRPPERGVQLDLQTGQRKGKCVLFLYNLNKQIWKRWDTMATECEGSLTAQKITVGNPGTILRDVETLIEFVGPGGIVTQGPNANLPFDRLPELNRSMCQMQFTFDYGDYWQFEVRLEAVDAGRCQLRKPKVIESAGKPPEQYPGAGS